MAEPGYIGFLTAPGIPELLLAGREREFLTEIAYSAMCTIPDAVNETDVDEFVRTYSRQNGWRGAIGLYQSMLKEGAEIRLSPSPGRCECRSLPLVQAVEASRRQP